MISAEQARKNSTENANKKYEKLINAAVDSIIKAIENGQFGTSISALTMSIQERNHVVDHLRSFGYQVSVDQGDSRDPYCTIQISWHAIANSGVR